MKTFLTARCLMIGITSTSFAANSVASTHVNSEVYSV